MANEERRIVVGDYLLVPDIIDNKIYHEIKVVGHSEKSWVLSNGRRVRKRDMKILGSSHRYARVKNKAVDAETAE